jgi:diketogulonate reductase-like aldo/keto reductase
MPLWFGRLEKRIKLTLVPEIGFGTWNYKRGVEPLWAAMQYGACLIDTAEAYGTEEIVG